MKKPVGPIARTVVYLGNGALAGDAVRSFDVSRDLSQQEGVKFISAPSSGMVADTGMIADPIFRTHLVSDPAQAPKPPQQPFITTKKTI